MEFGAGQDKPDPVRALPTASLPPSPKPPQVLTAPAPVQLALVVWPPVFVAAAGNPAHVPSSVWKVEAQGLGPSGVGVREEGGREWGRGGGRGEKGGRGGRRGNGHLRGTAPLLLALFLASSPWHYMTLVVPAVIRRGGARGALSPPIVAPGPSPSFPPS